LYLKGLLKNLLAVFASGAKQSRFMARNELRKFGVQNINKFEIAASRKALLAMTLPVFSAGSGLKPEPSH